jgi:hypothetical protein
MCKLYNWYADDFEWYTNDLIIMQIIFGARQRTALNLLLKYFGWPRAWRQFK